MALLAQSVTCRKWERKVLRLQNCRSETFGHLPAVVTSVEQVVFSWFVSFPVYQLALFHT